MLLLFIVIEENYNYQKIWFMLHMHCISKVVWWKVPYTLHCLNMLNDLSTASFDWPDAMKHANDSLSPAPVCLTAG